MTNAPPMYLPVYWKKREGLSASAPVLLNADMPMVLPAALLMIPGNPYIYTIILRGGFGSGFLQGEPYTGKIFYFQPFSMLNGVV